MNRDEILRMAREVWNEGGVYVGPYIGSLERFAALIAADELRRLSAVEAQRDALLAALCWIASVNAMDYEYQAKARAAIAAAEGEGK